MMLQMIMAKKKIHTKGLHICRLEGENLPINVLAF